MSHRRDDPMKMNDEPQMASARAAPRRIFALRPRAARGPRTGTPLLRAFLREEYLRQVLERRVRLRRFRQRTVSAPSAPTMRWHGMKIDKGLRPVAPLPRGCSRRLMAPRGRGTRSSRQGTAAILPYRAGTARPRAECSANSCAAREIFVARRGAKQDRQVAPAQPGRADRRLMPLPVEPRSHQRVTIARQHHRAQRGRMLVSVSAVMRIFQR